MKLKIYTMPPDFGNVSSFLMSFNIHLHTDEDVLMVLNARRNLGIKSMLSFHTSFGLPAGELELDAPV